MFLRLRQLCLVAEHLEPVIGDLCAIFDEPVCHRDPAVERYGLHNAMLALGSSFIEVVAPLRASTAAGRYLERRGGDGGYMVILDTESLPRWHSHLPTVGVGVASAYEHENFQGLQLHPRDTGGALLEINTTQGNSADLLGPYGPAGPDWPSGRRGRRVQAISAAILQSPDPSRLARHWGQILQRPIHPLARAHQPAWCLPLDAGALHFIPEADHRGEGLLAIALQCRNLQAIKDTARQRQCPVNDDSVHIGGMHFWLHACGETK